MALDQRRFHVYPLDGVVAITQTVGEGLAIERGHEMALTFDSDMRFMAGRYAGRDGNVYEGAFGFI